MRDGGNWVRGVVVTASVLLGWTVAGAKEGEQGPMSKPAAPVGYASIRVVRAEAGEPSRPAILLPSGYSLHTRGNYAVASDGEYYVFLAGPKGAAKGVRIAWPGAGVRAVICGHARLRLRPEGEAVVCDVPIQANSLRAAWNTLEIWAHLDEEDLPIRIEHNDPARRAGKYAQGPWAAGQAKACLNYLIACRQILRDWGLHRQIKRARLGTLSLMGFETNNPLHGDWPAHWHLIYYLPSRKGASSSEPPGSHVPHFYIDADGRTTSNQIVVFGRPELSRKAGAREPMVFTDPNGQARLAMDIRPDGGVDLGPAAGKWTYSIVAGDGQGRFTDSVRVLREGKEWIRVTVRDDTAKGELSIRVDPLDGAAEPLAETHRYDPLTGAAVAGGK